MQNKILKWGISRALHTMKITINNYLCRSAMILFFWYVLNRSEWLAHSVLA